MTAPVTQSLEDLIEEIATWPVGMPVRVMERVLARGASAVPAVLAALAGWQDDPERDRLWLIVLLGELRDTSAVEPLIGWMRATDDELALAAVEALAKIGPPAVPALLEAARAPDPRLRLCAYAGLGWIPDDRGHGALVEALGRDPERGDVAAMALGDLGRPDALSALYEAYRTCAPWQRIEFEDVLRDLRWPAPAAPGDRQGPAGARRASRDLRGVRRAARTPDGGAGVSRDRPRHHDVPAPVPGRGPRRGDRGPLRAARHAGREGVGAPGAGRAADPARPQALARRAGRAPALPPDLRVAHRAGRRGREPGPRPAPRRSVAARRAPRGPRGIPHAGSAARGARPSRRAQRPLLCGSGRKYKRCCLGRQGEMLQREGSREERS